jgi:hypothetical protein
MMGMALIHCPECNWEMSDRAAACPHCGAPFYADQYYEPKDYKYWIDKYKKQMSSNSVGFYDIAEDETDSGTKCYSVSKNSTAEMYLEQALMCAPEGEKSGIESLLRYNRGAYQEAQARARKMKRRW